MKKRPDKAETQAWVARRQSLMDRLESRFAELDHGLKAVEQKLLENGLDAENIDSDVPDASRRRHKPGKPR